MRMNWPKREYELTKWERDEYELTEKWVRVDQMRTRWVRIDRKVRVDQNEYELTWVRTDLSPNWLRTPNKTSNAFLLFYKFAFQ